MPPGEGCDAPSREGEAFSSTGLYRNAPDAVRQASRSLPLGGGSGRGYAGTAAMRDRDPNPRLREFARQMRRKPTDAEQRIWGAIRKGRMLGWYFRRQHPLSGYILDFYCDDLKLAIELDGSQHQTEKGHAADMQRDAHLQRLGICVLRFTDYDTLRYTDGVLSEIEQRCRERAAERGFVVGEPLGPTGVPTE